MDRRCSVLYRKVIGTAILLTAVLLSAGCAADPAKENFKTVSSNLERGGSFYQVYTENGTLKQLIDEYFAKLDRAVSESNLPEAKRSKMRGKLIAAKFIFQLFAFEQCSGVGASSTIRTASGEKNIFSNRFFIAIPHDRSCLPDWILNRRQSDVNSIAANLPAETFCRGHCAGSDPVDSVPDDRGQGARNGVPVFADFGTGSSVDNRLAPEKAA